MNIQAKLFCFTTALLLSTSAYVLIGSASPKITINCKQNNEQVRKQLLSYTPLGTKAEAVIDFVLSRLYFEGIFGSDVGIKPNPGIIVRIGHRNDNPPFGHTGVEASWKFDSDLKLQDIQIKSVPQDGPYNQSQGSNLEDKVKLDLRGSDSAIKQQIFKYTPIGSNRAIVERFIGTRLYFQGGSANGSVITGRPGPAVILGDYFDDQRLKAISVTVQWQFGDNDQLRAVDLWRVEKEPGARADN